VTAPLLLGVREAARELGVGRDAAYRLVRSGRLRSVSVAGRRLVPRTELEEFCRREVVRSESSGRVDDEGSRSREAFREP
jgi:excisionase family DNA binding protein